MLKRLIISWLSDLSDGKLLIQVGAILAAILNNAAFPLLQGGIPALQTLLTAFQDALKEAKNGGKIETLRKNNARGALVEAMKALAPKIEAEAEDDEEKLVSTKYPMQKDPTPVGIQAAPEKVVIKNGPTQGSALVRCASNPVKPIFEWQSAVGTGPLVWTSELPTQNCSMSFTGFAPGALLNVRVRQIVPAGSSDWSVPVSIYLN